MTFQKYQSANNAQGVLHMPISSSATSMQLKSGEGDRFPSIFPYLLTVEQLDSLSAVIKREIVKVTNKVGDVLTIVRSSGTCLPDETSTTQGTQAFSFDADVTRVMQYVVAEQITDIQEEIERIVDDELPNKLDISEYQEGKYVYGASSGGTDSYAITLPNPPTAYEVGQTFRFQADVGNTGSASLNVNGLGAITIKKLHDQDLETGDIEAGQIVVVAYDGTNFQMNSQVALIAEAETSKLTEKLLVAGEDGEAGDCLFDESSLDMLLATLSHNLGDSSGNTRLAIRLLGSGKSFDYFKLLLAKAVSPSVNLGIRIETDNAGSPSGTLVDANATATVLASGLTTSLVDTKVTLGGTITISKGTPVRLVLFAGTYGSETVNATNYFKVGYSSNNTTVRYEKLWNGSSRGSTTNKFFYVGGDFSYGSDSTEASGNTFPYNNRIYSSSSSRGLRFKTKGDYLKLYRVRISLATGGGISNIFLKDDSGNILATTTIPSGQTLSADFATLIILNPNTYYRLEQQQTNFIEQSFNNAPSWPRESTNLSWVSGSIDGVNDATKNRQILNVDVAVAKPSETLFANTILSKTDADYTYKLPTNALRIAKENFIAGSIPTVSLPGSVINSIPSVSANTDLFLSGTPGKVSTTPGTNRYYVGKVLPDGVNVRQNSKNLSQTTQTAGASPYTYQNTLGFPIVMTITGGTVSQIAISRDGTNFFQVAGATNGQVALQPMDYVKITYSSIPTLTIFYQ